MGSFIWNTTNEKKKKKRNLNKKENPWFYLFIVVTLYISDIACGLDTGNVTTLIYAALIPFFLVFVYKVYV